MIDITIEEIEKLHPCDEGMCWLKRQKDLRANILMESALKKKRSAPAYISWGIAYLLSQPGRLKYATNAAKLALRIFEKKFPNNNIPRKVVEAMENLDSTEDDLKTGLVKAQTLERSINKIHEYHVINSIICSLQIACGYEDSRYYAHFSAVYSVLSGVSWRPILEYGLKLLEEERK